MPNDEIHKNILLHKIIREGEDTSFLEVQPSFESSFPKNILSIDSSGNISWNPFPSYPEIPEFHIIEDEKIRETNIFYKNGRIGISRPPLMNYIFDLAVPTNTLMTAFHIGDGSFGFSMGNGTSQGFIPEIIGMGSDENDAGLYFLGKAGNNKESSIPLIIIDGRDSAHGSLINRPIFGITSGDYENYKLLVDQKGRVGIGKAPINYKLEVEGPVEAGDFIIGELSIKALIGVVKELQEEIDRINNKIK